MALKEKITAISSIEDFKLYILQSKRTSIGFNNKFEMNYSLNQKALLDGLQESTFWNKFKQDLKETDAAYRRDNEDFDLIPFLSSIELKCKSSKRAIEKAYRISILNNNDAVFESNEYYDNFVLPENVFEKLNDIIRTEVIVKYLDGIDIVVSKIENLAKELDYEIEIEPKSTDAGYYAKHIYLSYITKIVDFEFNIKQIKFTFEIQVRTQLQKTIKSILHKYYEGDRLKSSENQDEENWRWQFNRPRFITNYIGHILHFFDGLIVQIKNKGGRNE